MATIAQEELYPDFFSASTETHTSSAVPGLETGFKIWIKAQMACTIARDGIKDIVLSAINQFHNEIMTVLPNKCNKCYTGNVLSCPTPNFCRISVNFQKCRQCSYHCGNHVHRPCFNDVCQRIAKAILQEHTGRPSWRNTDATKWRDDAFEIAKCFLPFGYTASSIDETDFYGVTCIMTAMKRFQKIFTDDISQPENIIKKARNAAKRVRRSPDLTMAYSELEEIINLFLAMLTDNIFVKNNKKASGTIRRLKELLSGNVGIFKTTSVIEAFESIEKSEKIELSEEEEEEKMTVGYQRHEHRKEIQIKTKRIKRAVRLLKRMSGKHYLNENDLALLDIELKSDTDDLQQEDKAKENSTQSSPCCICQERKPSVLTRNCGHLVMCRTCYNALEEKRCPLCRQEYKDKESRQEVIHVPEDILFQIDDKNVWRHCIDTLDEEMARKLIGTKILPQHDELEACLKSGFSSKILKEIYRAIEDTLTASSDHVVYTQASYLLNAKDQIVFVVFTDEMQLHFEENFIYKIVIRRMNECSNEANTVIQREVSDSQTFSQTDMEKIATCLRQHSPRLMEEHSNLSMTSASRYKCKHYNEYGKDTIMESEPCIVFYVTAKGLIPAGEKSLPEFLSIGNSTFKTDVREGRFSFAVGGEPTAKHQNIKIGCRIESTGKRGTLGGFVDHPSYGLCAMTCAHVMLSAEEMFQYKNGKIKNVKRPCYQPNEPDKCGDMLKIFLREGGENSTGLDIAFIKVSEERQPVCGDFPDYAISEWKGNCGYCRDELFKSKLAYNTGAVLSKDVIPSNRKVVKYGQKTKLTEGKLHVYGGSTAPEIYLNLTGKRKRRRFKFYNQLHIYNTSHKFCESGDSGSLIFSRDSDNELYAIGILIGKGDETNISFATPMSSILSEIGLEEPFSLLPFDPNQCLEDKINRSYNEVKKVLDEHSKQISGVQDSVDQLSDKFKEHTKRIETMFANREKKNESNQATSSGSQSENKTNSEN